MWSLSRTCTARQRENLSRQTTRKNEGEAVSDVGNGEDDESDGEQRGKSADLAQRNMGRGGGGLKRVRVCRFCAGEYVWQFERHRARRALFLLCCRGRDCCCPGSGACQSQSPCAAPDQSVLRRSCSLSSPSVRG